MYMHNSVSIIFTVQQICNYVLAIVACIVDLGLEPVATYINYVCSHIQFLVQLCCLTFRVN